MSGKKLYTRDSTGGIRFNSGRKPGEVRIPNYVYDLWLPLIGTEAITVYAVYCRLERAEIVKAITMETIAKCCRMSKTTLGKLNDILAECGFIAIKKPEGNRRAHHMTNEITVNDPPQKISAELIAKYKPNSGYQPLSEWLCEVPPSTSHEVPDSTSRGTKQYHDEVPDSTSTMLQPSSLQPSSIAVVKNAPNGAEPPLNIVIPSPKKTQWADEDCIIDVWAGIRKLDAIAMGADYHTDSDRKKAKKMLAWTKPVTPDEIREAMRISKYKGDYPFAFLEKDILELRAKAPKAPPGSAPPPSNGEYIRPLSPAQLREKEAREKLESERAS